MMAVSEIALFGDCRKFSRKGVERAFALVLVLTVSLITVSCGSNAQGANSNSPQALVVSGSLPAGAVDQSYNAVLSVNGGTSPYQFSLASGSLPPGITLNQATGSFTGQPTTAGFYSFEVMVKDSPRPDHGTQSFAVQVSTGGSGVSVSVSPTSATLSSGGSKQFSATVTGTANTAVTWTASAGSVSTSGLYTAPTVQSATQATVTATSQADTTKSASSAITINPSQGGQSLQITTSGLPQGQQGETYSASFTATGGNQPYSWSLSGGSLPAGISLGTSGDLTGTPAAVGTSNFSVTVTDSASHTASGSFGVVVVSSSGYDGPAQLPLVTVAATMADSPAPGSVINVNAGGNLQTALNNAQCGQTIQLQAGSSFNGPFNLPAKGCNDQNWIIIRTSSPDSSLPADGQRVTPCYAGVASLEGRPAYTCTNPVNVLAKVQMVNGGNGPIVIANGANFYRFVGLEITRQNGIKGSATLIGLAGTADHIIVDRSWLHGNAQDETSNGFSMSGGTYIAIVDSYFSDFHCISATGSCTDSHAAGGGVTDTQDGPYLIQNNFLEAAGEAVMFGGGAATLTPTDITIIGNHFFKPWQWMKGSNPFVGGPEGNPFIVKNHLELKNAVRVLVEANLMEDSWGGFTQKGHGILLTPKNQHTRTGANVCPICQVTDVTIRYTQISHAGGGMVIATVLSGDGEGGAPALAGTRFSIHDIVMDDLNKKYVGGGDGFMIANNWPTNPVNTITINHTTVFPDAKSHALTMGNVAGDAAMYGLVYTNNLTLTGQYPVWDVFGGGLDSCSSGDVPITSIQNCFTSFNFQTNGLIASPSHFPPSKWPANNLFPATAAAVQFVNYNNGNGGDYQLQSTSPYKNAGSDGKDLGADIVGLQAALAGVE
ncbi:MAG: Ig domain-containing protein [Terriglobales bacterium]